MLRFNFGLRKKRKKQIERKEQVIGKEGGGKSGKNIKSSFCLTR